MKILGKFTKEKTLLLSLLMIASTLLMTSAAVQRTWESGSGGGGLIQTPATFTNYELAGKQFLAGHSQGVSCPNAATVENQKSYSTHAEPAIRSRSPRHIYR